MALVPLGAAVDKVVVTNIDAIRVKYGQSGVSRIRSALRTLVAEDGERDVATAIVDMSSPTTADRVAAPVVDDPADHAGTKRFVDALCTLTSPDYVLLLGGPDVVAHVPLANSVPSPDPDPDVPSDLPYVCSTAAGTNPAAFIGPDRVVGRLPDVAGASGTDSASAFAAVIRSAARWTGAPADHYRNHLTVGTSRWQLSTAATATMLFGIGAAVQHAPPATQPLPPADLERPLHWMNLHGATADTRWLGDPGFAVTLAADEIRDHAAARTVAITEACFGAELFDPLLTGGSLPFPLAYLAAGAYGLVGSTCISYGGRTAPDGADVLCRYVVEELLQGASLGRALLHARQRYALEQPVVTPVDLKTLSQFNLLGDPSIHPVTAAVTGTRAMRRRSLAAAGPSIARSTAVDAHHGQPSVPGGDAPAAVNLAGRGRRATTFEVAADDIVDAALPARLIHVTANRLRGPSALARLVVREASEDASGVSAYRTLESKGFVPQACAVDEQRHVRGVVHSELYAAGSKSEHVAVVLNADDGNAYVLRRPGANPFEDPALTELDGATIDAYGLCHRDVLLIDHYDVITESALRRPDEPAEPRPSARPRRRRRLRSGP